MFKLVEVDGSAGQTKGVQTCANCTRSFRTCTSEWLQSFGAEVWCRRPNDGLMRAHQGSGHELASGQKCDRLSG